MTIKDATGFMLDPLDLAQPRHHRRGATTGATHVACSTGPSKGREAKEARLQAACGWSGFLRAHL
jgi:hypothetical protein